MTTQPTNPKRWQFSLHSMFVTATLMAVALAIGSHFGVHVVAFCVLMVFLSPFFVAVYIVVALAAEWISERMSNWSR